MSLIPPATARAWTRHGMGEQPKGAALIGIYGGGSSGKTRLACSAMRGAPEWFGSKAVYIAIDPETASLGPVLPPDRKNLEVVTINLDKDVYDQVKDIYSFNWRAEGFDTVITDTFTILSQVMLGQLTNSGRFSDKGIQISGADKLSQQGDYLATGVLMSTLLRRQLASGMNHLTLFHEQEVRPDAGKPGEPIGGPMTVGKASVRTVVNWYNTFFHMVEEPKKRTDLTKPLEYQRVVRTARHGIWQAKLRSPELENKLPEIVAEPDPINVWRVLDKTLNLRKDNA